MRVARLLGFGLTLFLMGCGGGTAPAPVAKQDPPAKTEAAPVTETDDEPSAEKPDPTPLPETKDGKKSLRPEPGEDLLTARKGFETKLVSEGFEKPNTAPPKPPKGVFDRIQFETPLGKNWAYLTPDPQDGQRHPAMLWAKGGFGGIGQGFWNPAPRSNDQSASAFRKAGIVLMCPSWRGECNNPGRYEMFYGEVEDMLAALDYLRSLPWVDPDRVYIGGHSTGGTMTLLLACSTDKFRAAFSFGGAPDMWRVVKDGKGYGNTPYDHTRRVESSFRSAIQFVSAIRCPTFYFEGQDSSYNADARLMMWRAKDAGAPFKPYMIQRANHFNILAPLTELVAAKILADTGPECNIDFTLEEVHKAYAGVE